MFARYSNASGDKACLVVRDARHVCNVAYLTSTPHEPPFVRCVMIVWWCSGCHASCDDCVVGSNENSCVTCATGFFFFNVSEPLPASHPGACVGKGLLAQSPVFACAPVRVPLFRCAYACLCCVCRERGAVSECLSVFELCLCSCMHQDGYDRVDM